MRRPTLKIELQPSTQLRKAVSGGSLPLEGFAGKGKDMQTRSFSIRALSAVAAITFAAVFAWSARGAEYVVQPGPADSKDIWTTSVFSFAPGGSYPGGGLDDYRLHIGGWGDLYHALIQFDLSQVPGNATSAVLYLYCFSYNNDSGTPMYLDRITQAWDWRTSGTGRDRERLWWADRPAATQWIPYVLPTPLLGQWYAVDITDLYNGWKSGLYPNYGLQLRPQLSWNTWNSFYSADYTNDVSLRPKLVIQAPSTPTLSIRVSQVELCWDTQTNAWYQLQYSSSLTTNQWVPFYGTWIKGNNAQYCTNDAVLVGTPKRFYQLSVTNSPPQ